MYHTIILPNISSIFNRTYIFSCNKIIAEKISLETIFMTKTDKLIKIDKKLWISQIILERKINFD